MSEAEDHKEKMKALQKEQRQKVRAKLIDRGVLIVNTRSVVGIVIGAIYNSSRATAQTGQ